MTAIHWRQECISRARPLSSNVKRRHWCRRTSRFLYKQTFACWSRRPPWWPPTEQQTGWKKRYEQFTGKQPYAGYVEQHELGGRRAGDDIDPHVLQTQVKRSGRPDSSEERRER